MKIIIVGAGKVGANLARQLSSENHDITIIDKNNNVLNRVIESADCLGINGNGAVQSVLLEAGINDCNLLIATTNSDEVNMLTCLMAHKTSNCAAIARIRDPEYAEEINYLQNEFNLSMVINPELEAANEIYRLIKYSSSLISESFFNDQVHLHKIAVKEKSPLSNMFLKDVVKKLECNVVLCTIEREDEIIIPKGNDKILPNDQISFVADVDNANKFFDYAGYPYKNIKNLFIIGGGKIAYYLIKKIKENNKSINIKIMDSNKEVCIDLADNFSDITVVHGDGSDQRLLVQEGINYVDAFISLTGIDEENMIYSLFAKKMGCKKILTKINRISFTDTLNEIDIGSIINPEIITANLITKQVRSLEYGLGNDIVNFYSLNKGQVEAMELYISEDNDATNKMFKNLNIKKDVIVACIKRNNKIIIPTGNDIILKNDNVILVTKNLKINNIKDILLK